MEPGLTEVEAALLITSTPPEVVAAAIAGLAALGAFRLVPKPPEHIRDRHVDTPEGTLASHEFALRLRTVNGDDWISLKGPAQRTTWGGVERLEIERPWSPAAATELLEGLRRRTVGLPAPAARPGTTPIATLERCGLQVIQDRETARQRRALVAGPHPEAPTLAEMAIDAVTYHFRQRVRLHVVEIEAKIAHGAAAVQGGVDALLDAFRDSLRVWPYGKLRTGQVIQLLLRSGADAELLTPDGALRPRAWQLIERHGGAR